MSRYVRFLSRHDLAICAAALLLFVGALLTATRLHLRSDFRELLPQADPELKLLQQIGDRWGAARRWWWRSRDRIPSPTSASPTPWSPTCGRSWDGICAPSTTAPTPASRSSRRTSSSTPTSPTCGGPTTILKKLLVSKKNPAFVAFADEDLGEKKDDPAAHLKQLKRDIEQRRGPARFPNGYYESADWKLLAVLTWANSSGTGDLSGFRSATTSSASSIRPTRPASVRSRRRSPATSPAPSRSTTR